MSERKPPSFRDEVLSQDTEKASVDWRLEQEQIFKDRQFEQDCRQREQEVMGDTPQPIDGPPPPKPAPRKIADPATVINVLSYVFTALNVKAWPTWAKVVVAIPVIAGLAIIYKQQRIDSQGVVLFPEVHPGIVWFDNGSAMGKVQYPAGESFPRDGLAAFHVTWEEYQKLPAALPATRDDSKAWQQSDFPAVVYCNSSGFDSSAAPVAVRHAHDGKLLFHKKPAAGLVKLLVPTDGGYLVYTADGKIEMNERTWVEQYMGLTYQPPPQPNPQPTPQPAPTSPTTPKVFTPEKK